MHSTKKRKGISLTHFVDRPVVVCTNYNPELFITKSLPNRGSQYLVRSSSLPNQYRVSIPTKTKVSISYQDSRSYRASVQPCVVRSTTRRVSAVPITQRYQPFNHYDKKVKDNVFGDSYIESKDIISRRLFTEQQSRLLADRVKTQGNYSEPPRSNEFDQNRSVYSSLFSFKQSHEGKKLRLQLKKDVMNFKVDKGTIQKEDTQSEAKLNVKNQSIPSTNAKSKVNQEGSPAKNLEDLKEIQIKLRDIVKACQERY